jgi:glycosyltransferase involved in cell wall biosynthesis
MISVALCTYNGARYLAEQLESLAAQTRRPDELVIGDDRSSDATVEQVRAFAARSPFPVHLSVNEQNLGSTRNFAATVGRCSGDLIALCDQDDVWLPHKLADLEAAFADPVVGFAFGDAEMVDERLTPLGYRLWEALRFWPREQRRFQRGGAFEGLLRRYRATGATMAFRASFRTHVLPIPPAWIHDAWIALIISALAPCVPIAHPLIRYRQHPTQQLGEKRRGLLGQYRVARRMTRGTYAAVAERYTEALERLRTVPGVAPERLQRLGEKVEHYRQRTAMRDPGTWRLPLVLRGLWRGHYARYSLGWKAVAQDLFLP